MEPTIKKLTSRKFLLALFTFVAAVAESFGIATISTMDPVALASAAGVLIAWLTGETYLDSKRINTDQQIALKNLQQEANAYIAQLQSKLEAAEASQVTPEDVIAAVTEANASD